MFNWNLDLSKNWQILSLSDDKYKIHDDIKTVRYYRTNGYGQDKYYGLNNKDLYIHSILRKSDGCIFTINDMVRNINNVSQKYLKLCHIDTQFLGVVDQEVILLTLDNFVSYKVVSNMKYKPHFITKLFNRKNNIDNLLI